MMPNSARIAPFEGKNTILPLVDNSKSEDKHLQVKIKKKKKKRRRQRDAAARRKAYNEVRGFAAFASCLRAGVAMIASYVTSVFIP